MMDFDFGQLTLQRAHGMCACLSAHEHEQMLTQARNGVLAKKQQLQSELLALEQTHSELMAKLQEEQAVVPPVRMSSCQLSLPYLDLFDRLVKDKKFRAAGNI